MALDKLGGNSFSTGAIANSLGYTPANKAGDTFTGAVSIAGPATSNGVTLGLSDSSSSADSRHILITRGSSNAVVGIAGSQTNDPLWISRTGGYDVMVSSTGALMLNTTSDSNINDTSSVVKLVINGDQHFPRQSAKIYFGDVTSNTPLSIGEGLQADAGTDKDFMSLYMRNSLRVHGFTPGNSSVSTEVCRITGSGILMGSEPYGIYTKTIQTPNGGAQTCRFIEDCLGRWVLVGKFAADASVSIGGTWSSVRGLSTSTSQSDTTAFSADWGDSYPTEVRVLGSTNFDFWKENRTIDFIYRVPSGRNWATFFNNGSSTMDSQSTRFGFAVTGAYDGFGRWNNPSMNWMGMSDAATTNPSSAYTTPTSSAFNWNTAGDAKLTAIHTGAYSGQDYTETVGFGFDDTTRGFSDAYPSTQSNMQGGTAYSSAVWILIKLN